MPLKKQSFSANKVPICDETVAYTKGGVMADAYVAI